MNRLNGKVCIVTGGSQGIGRAIVELFATEGAEVVYSLDLQKAEFAQANVVSKILNTTNSLATRTVVDDIKEKHGHIDVIVNNAGITRDALVAKMTEEQWNAVIDVNLKGPFYMVQAAANYLMEQETASIITLSSVVGLYGNVGQANYAATKAGVIAMSKSWTKELSRRGANIRANAIAPGFINTAILQTMPPQIIEGMKQKVLFKKLGDVADVANLALFLASDESKYITGQVLEVSGGLSL
jgi:3-oxoacyl-[acyl-carrier protein] reductase